MSKIRWLLILPVSILGWYLVFIIGMGLLGLVENRCPEAQMISGRCTASWYTNAKDAVIILLAGLSAVIVVLVSYFLAPAYKSATAIVAFFVGAAVATYVVLDTGSWFEYIAAITGGLSTMFLVSRREWGSEKKPDTADKEG